MNSMVGTYWPPISRLQHIIDELKRLHAAKGPTDLVNEEGTSNTQGSTSNLTADQLAAQERAAKLAQAESAENGTVRTGLGERGEHQPVQDSALSATSASETNSDVSSKDVKSPEAKRSKQLPLDSPSNQNVPRSPHAFQEVIEGAAEEEEQRAEPMDFAGADDVLLVGAKDASAEVSEAFRQRQRDLAASKDKIMAAGEDASLQIKIEEVQKYESNYMPPTFTSQASTSQQSQPDHGAASSSNQQAAPLSDQQAATKGTCTSRV